jgi:hypothetical protein
VRSRTRGRFAQHGVPPIPFPDRGRLWYDFEIAKEFFQDLPGIERKVRWVREHLPRETRIKIGQKSAWYETDIRAFLESQRTGS